MRLGCFVIVILFASVVEAGWLDLIGCNHRFPSGARCGKTRVDGSDYCENHKCALCNGDVWADDRCVRCANQTVEPEAPKAHAQTEQRPIDEKEAQARAERAREEYAAREERAREAYERGKREVEATRIRAEKGEAAAQYRLGVCYEDGKGVRKSLSEAVLWYRKAAEQGYVDAQNQLGMCYDNGEGVVKSPSEAVLWYRKAAEQGHAAAQYNLGVCYENGEGVEKSLFEAVQWYRKAAAQGDEDAQYNLGVCYENGKGVEQSLSDAVHWYSCAAAQGHSKAKRAHARTEKVALEREKRAQQHALVLARWKRQQEIKRAKEAEKIDLHLRRVREKIQNFDVEEARCRFADYKALSGEKIVSDETLQNEIDALEDKMKKRYSELLATPTPTNTLVFKHLYLGMPVEDAKVILYHHRIDYDSLSASEGMVMEFKFSRSEVNSLFKTSGMSTEGFFKQFRSAYSNCLPDECRGGTWLVGDDRKWYKIESPNGFVVEVNNRNGHYLMVRKIASKSETAFD